MLSFLSHRDNNSKSWLLNALHCSIKGIAENYPIVCDQELDLIRKLFPDCKVERIQWSIEGAQSCAYEIIPMQN